MGFFDRFRPWHNPEKDDMKDKRIERAVDRSKDVQKKLKDMADSYRVAGPAPQQIRQQPPR